MKKILPILLSMVVVISIFATMALGTNATDVDPIYYVSGDYTYTVLGTTDANIAGYSGSDTQLIIPETLDKYKVTSIDDFAFMQNMTLTSVTVPQSVVKVGEYAFLETALTSITFLNAECEIFDSEYTIVQTATIYGYDNSTAKAYAEKYGRVFEVLTEQPTETTDVTQEVPTETEAVTEPQSVLGDVDGDGEVSVMDATQIQLHLASIQLIPEENLPAGDTDRDSELSVLDATQIQLFLAQLIETL